MKRTLLLLALVAVLPRVAVAKQPPAPLKLRPLPIAEGIRDVLNVGGDPKKLRAQRTYKLADRNGVDLAKPQKDPVVAFRRGPRALFYVFYKTVEEAFDDQLYLIQRIKRTERNWKTPYSKPETEVTYQTEALKLQWGAQKRGDQHHGRHPLGDWHKREIVKEYELGFGVVPGLCEGDAWPFDPKLLFHCLERYGPERKIFDQVRFSRSAKWTLTVELDAKGGYALRAPELGIDLPAKPTDPARCVPEADAGSRELVVVRGKGLRGAGTGEKLLPSLEKLGGSMLHKTTLPNGSSYYSFASRVTAQLRKNGDLSILLTRRGFAGQTALGARHGDSRARIMELYGVPKRQYTDSAWWDYGDIVFWFTGTHRVGRIFVRVRS